MVVFFQNSEIQIYRRRRVGSTHTFAMSATFTAYSSDIQPASQERTEFVQGRFGKTYTAFVEASVDIKEADQLVVIGGEYNNRRFSVKGVSQWGGAGLLDHTELIIAAQDG